jgi:hypothetical protein
MAAINSKPAAGRIMFRLFDDVAPRTAQNFRELATGQHGFGFAQSSFHRIIPGVRVGIPHLLLHFGVLLFFQIFLLDRSSTKTPPSVHVAS